MSDERKRNLSVCIAGATGWTGPALVRGVLDAPDLALRSAVSRSAAGRDLGEALGGDALGVPVHATVAECACRASLSPPRSSPACPTSA
jgi:dihydrodipicolinate reductase